MFDPNNLILSSKRKTVTLVLFHIFIHIYFLDQIGSQLAYFLKLLKI